MPRMADGFRGLDACVHCGFCLPACPTYLATADENDSPRGRIVLMRALERGEIGADDPSLRQHLDACLGCRGCEPACPSGVEYGRGLAAARERLSAAGSLGWKARAVLAVFGRSWIWRPLFTVARWMRETGLPRRWSASRFSMGMLDASAPWTGGPARGPARGGTAPGSVGTAAIFRGCVMDTLFGHVHDATRVALEAAGYRVVAVGGQGCCGALHEHAGDRPAARRLARVNVRAFNDAGADVVVVNSAGCGALLKEYAHLLDGPDAARFAERVRDVTEVLARADLRRPLAPLTLEVVYDAPCHLQHAQGVHGQVLQMLGRIPGLQVRTLPGFDRCCGSAGLYSMVEPAMSRAVLADKVRVIAAAEPRPDVVVTGNPGCIMQIGAGLRAEGIRIPVVHSVELMARAAVEESPR